MTGSDVILCVLARHKDGLDFPALRSEAAREPDMPKSYATQPHALLGRLGSLIARRRKIDLVDKKYRLR